MTVLSSAYAPSILMNPPYGAGLHGPASHPFVLLSCVLGSKLGFSLAPSDTAVFEMERTSA